MSIRPMKRRIYLTTAAAAAAALAGCAGRDDADTDHEEDDDDTDSDDDTDQYPALVGTFDDFEDLSEWELVAGSLEADDGRLSVGSQSAHLTTTETEEQSRITQELSEPIDVEDVVPGLALSTSSAASPIIQLHDDDGDFLEFQQHVRAEQPFVRHNFGHTAVSGDPDLSEITEIQIGSWTGDEHEGELWVDDLHFVPRVTTGRVMVQFQGGFETDYTEAFPIMEEYDLTGSTFVATDRIRESEDAEGDRMTEEQLDELVEAGWSVGTVGARGLHLHEVEPDRVESDILDPLDWLDEHGYGDSRYFAFPGGRYDGAMYDLVAENYDLGFAGRHRSQGWASNPFTVTRISGEVGQRNLDGEQMIDALDWTAEHGGITTIVFYEMDGDDAAELEEMAGHLADLESSGEVELVTPGEIADEYVL
ncbi:polysaccharide deacetylase family protein [Natrialbaceae archaeon A-arb3/5]